MESYMHDVDRGVELCNIVLENVEMKGWSQKPSSARPRIPIAQQQTLSCEKETRVKSTLFVCFLQISLSGTWKLRITEPWTQVSINELVLHGDVCCMDKTLSKENPNKHFNFLCTVIMNCVTLEWSNLVPSEEVWQSRGGRVAPDDRKGQWTSCRSAGMFAPDRPPAEDLLHCSASENHLRRLLNLQIWLVSTSQIMLSWSTISCSPLTSIKTKI